MRYTFKPDDCMVVTIPLGSIRNAREGQLMPDKFTCRFKDTYKVFQRGRPKALGAAQIITAVFILCLGGILFHWHERHWWSGIGLGLTYMVPSILIFNASERTAGFKKLYRAEGNYILCGILTIAAGQTPLMPMMKASFSFNIIGLFIAIIIIIIGLIIAFTGPCPFHPENRNMCVGLPVVIVVLYAFEFLLSVILIHWESKAVCRAHFNSLPMITLKQDM